MTNNLLVRTSNRSGSILDLLWPGIQSVPQANLNGRVGNVWIAKQVGGGSSVNAMMNMRGSAEDYDRWSALFGDEAQQGTADWSWDGILPFFKKGDSSEIYAGWPRLYYPGVTPLFEAFKEIDGVEFPSDSGAGKAGVFWFPTLMDPRTVTRSYAGTGHYLNINATRPNYHLLIKTQVRRLLVDDELSATGVEFPLGNNTLLTVKAKKEVILSAGTIHTPHLLQVSSIGPKKILEAGGIDVLVDLPGPYSIALANLAGWLPFTVVSDKADELATKLEQQDFASLLPAGADATVVAGFEAQMKMLAAQMRSKDTAFTRLQLIADHGAQGPVAMQSFSRGTVNINTTDPLNTEPTSLASEFGPVDAMSPTDYHPVGTASMLPLELGGVVDQTLRVYGVKNLRVIDASVMPMVPSANTCQPTYALAEKAAEIVKQGI
ncbi:FAD/NAD(P)-binding domain-containing protein [Colletotrichum caudatum]|nr:FAD/NAD(P)-binding domain-containing protein [Colletotrichum caudatum]